MRLVFVYLYFLKPVVWLRDWIHLWFWKDSVFDLILGRLLSLLSLSFCPIKSACAKNNNTGSVLHFFKEGCWRFCLFFPTQALGKEPCNEFSEQALTLELLWRTRLDTRGILGTHCFAFCSGGASGVFVCFLPLKSWAKSHAMRSSSGL